MKKLRFLNNIAFGLLILSSFFQMACERIPDWERHAANVEDVSEANRLIEMKRWIWTCRGTITKYGFSRRSSWLGRDIEDFLDYFRVKGLNTIQTVSAKTLLGSALLWNDAGFLVAFLPNLQDVRDIECTNGSMGWRPAIPHGFDRSLDLAVLKVELSKSAQIKQGNRWIARYDRPSSSEKLSVLSSAYPGVMDRLYVSAQAMAAPLQTGIDDNLILFLPPPTQVSVGGVLVDEQIRVVGYLMKPTSNIWGASLGMEEFESIASSILKKQKVERPYLGFKLRWGLDQGLVVQQIDVGSPSHQAGLRVQDRIVKWDGRELSSLTDWHELNSGDIGRHIAMTYRRGGRMIEAQLKVASSE
jgi:S1-C subfamily serine protease